MNAGACNGDAAFRRAGQDASSASGGSSYASCSGVQVRLLRTAPPRHVTASSLPVCPLTRQAESQVRVFALMARPIAAVTGTHASLLSPPSMERPMGGALPCTAGSGGRAVRRGRRVRGACCLEMSGHFAATNPRHFQTARSRALTRGPALMVHRASRCFHSARAGGRDARGQKGAGRSIVTRCPVTGCWNDRASACRCSRGPGWP